eukprot:Skav204145  [mRNA]  locus=scaffold903:94509:100854:+ [translate_table: standard]
MSEFLLRLACVPEGKELTDPKGASKTIVKEVAKSRDPQRGHRRAAGERGAFRGFRRSGYLMPKYGLAVSCWVERGWECVSAKRTSINPCTDLRRQGNWQAMRAAAASAEFLGTVVLSLTVACNVLSNSSSDSPMGWEIASMACALLAVMSAFGSGGHFNPSVSVAMLCAGKMQIMDALAYIVLQVAGATLSMLFARNLFERSPYEAQPAVIHITDREFAVEMIYAFMLNFVILCVSGKRNNPENEPNQFYGVAASATFAAGLASTRLKTGAWAPSHKTVESSCTGIRGTQGLR